MKTTHLLLPLLLIALMGGPMACRKTPIVTGTAVTPPPPASDTATTFRNPLLRVGPDPWVVYQDGFYYVTHTTGNNLTLYKTKKMSLLSSSQYSAVWSPPANGPATRDIWAPELHRVNEKWYAYYAAVVAPNNQHRMYVLENEALDPLQGRWVSKGEVKLGDDKWAIDGTLLNLNGQLYLAWSGWPGGSDGVQNLYISKMRDPWTADGPRVLLSTPTFDWETQGSPDVNEGPQFLIRNNKVFLIYSASHCSTDAYALGQLTANATTDLTNPASWTKSATPVFGPHATNGTYGVGHNSFFSTPGGKEDWIVYHANAAPGQGCADFRSVRMQRFAWKADGSPDFGQPAALTDLLKRPVGE